MSWSLQLKNGDLRLEGTKLATVTEANKLQQDLRCALLERMGTDPMHPSFGSLIDGGRLPDGTTIPSPLGDTDFQRVATVVRSEINKIARQYQRRQLARAQADRTRYGKPTLSRQEILVNVSDIQVYQVADAMFARVVLVTGGNQQTFLDIALALEDAE